MKTNNVNVLTATMLRQAARLADRIENRTAKFNAANAKDAKAFAALTGQTLGQTVSAPNLKVPAKGGAKRVMSAATKAKIAAGQAKRWATARAAAGNQTSPATPATPAATAPAPAVK